MLEIERKFLVADPQAVIAAAVSESEIAQGYLSADPEATVRVRLRGDRGFLTVKSKNEGSVRNEWEYEIPADDARRMLLLSRTPVLRKIRRLVPFGGLTWEIDFFSNPAGLILAEVEIPRPDYHVELPSWLGPEVTGDPAYFNSAIALRASDDSTRQRH